MFTFFYNLKFSPGRNRLNAISATKSSTRMEIWKLTRGYTRERSLLFANSTNVGKASRPTDTYLTISEGIWNLSKLIINFLYLRLDLSSAKYVRRASIDAVVSRVIILCIWVRSPLSVLMKVVGAPIRSEATWKLTWKSM